jgi:trk system potassium uptake protein TrkA
VALVTRLGDGLLPSADTVYQDGDLVHILTTAAALTSVERTLDQLPPAF